MRRLFIESDTRLWVNPTRSARMQGMVTSVRLEISFWEILADLAAIEVCATGYHPLQIPRGVAITTDTSIAKQVPQELQLASQ
jgi:hypothetical protein